MSQELQFHAAGCFEVIVMETEKLVVGVKCKNDGTSAKHQNDEVQTLLFGCTHRIEEICFTNRGGASNHRPFVDMGAAVPSMVSRRSRQQDFRYIGICY